jgi:hypothetical protein
VRMGSKLCMGYKILLHMFTMLQAIYGSYEKGGIEAIDMVGLWMLPVCFLGCFEASSFRLLLPRALPSCSMH